MLCDGRESSHVSVKTHCTYMLCGPWKGLWALWKFIYVEEDKGKPALPWEVSGSAGPTLHLDGTQECWRAPCQEAQLLDTCRHRGFVGPQTRVPQPQCQCSVHPAVG